jgi:hypothetical protein
MPIYANLIDPYPVFSGGVTVASHQGWGRVELVEFVRLGSSGSPQAAREPGAPGINEIVVTKLQDCTSAVWVKLRLKAAFPTDADPIGVRLDFVGAGSRSGEPPLLSLDLQQVTIDGGATGPRSFRLRCRKITNAALPPSSPDISYFVKSTLRRAGSTHVGGLNAVLMDGSVRF